VLVHSREVAIIVVIALLALAGSQLPRLVRALGDPGAKHHDDADAPSEVPDR